MDIMHVALGGCLRAPPVRYGLTEDTGGHIAYVLGAASAQSARPGTRATIVTRAFDDPALGAVHGRTEERLGPDLVIRRLVTQNRRYLEKAELWDEVPALEAVFLQMIGAMARRPDVIHAHFADAAILARAASRRFGIPWFYTPHSLSEDKRGLGYGGEDVRLGAERAAIAGADAIIVSSRDEAERQIAAYDARAAGRVHHVAPGVSLPRSEGTAAARALLAPFLRDPAKPLLLAIARPVRKKNLAGLLAAYAGDRALRERANLAIVAGLRDGPESGGEEQRAVIGALLGGIDRHDLWGCVALPRRHLPEHVPQLYRLAAESGGLFVNPALHEPFGLTVLEAAEFGLPVVATREGGPSGILAALGHGRLVDPESPGEIAAACHALLAPGARVQAADAALRGRGRFSWDAWAQRVDGIARQITAPATRFPPGPAIAFLACDIDDTLTGDAGGAAAFSRWNAARDTARLPFAVATGRSVGEARRVLAEWRLPEPDLYITSCGSEIWRVAAPGGLILCEAYAAMIGADWDRGAVLRIADGSGMEWQAPLEQRPWKLGLYGTEAEATRLARALDAAGVPGRVIASHGRFVDILPRRSGKAGALEFEAERRGLALADCIAAGDSGNDSDMLIAAGRAILPANARAEIAGLGPRPGLVRTRAAHAAGVLEGLAIFGFTVTPRALAAE